MTKGQSVLCVNNTIVDESVLKGYQCWLNTLTIYTIRELIYDENDLLIGVLLNEVVNQNVFIEESCSIREPAFALFRFQLLPNCVKARNAILLNKRPLLN